MIQFLSTLPARGATRPGSSPGGRTNISIHAPREGSDPQGALVGAGEVQISIHAPREGSDDLWRQWRDDVRIFLSTLPARGATRQPPLLAGGLRNFYPRSPRGERPIDPPNDAGYIDFYPRSPRGERPTSCKVTEGLNGISIHAPREGSDHPVFAAMGAIHISIHAPREGSDARPPAS